MTSANSIQNIFITDLIRNQSSVSIYLKNCIRLRGCMILNDDRSLFLKDEQGTLLMIYKKNITTILPETPYLKFENE